MQVEKAAPPHTPDDLARRSVAGPVDDPSVAALPSIETSLLFLIGQMADEILPWGQGPKVRDRQLREFVSTESLFSSALGIICARNAAFSWELSGPGALVSQMQMALESANYGKGWQNLMLKLSFDLYTQDHGAFVEVVRAGDKPNSPFISLNHLDAARCYPTGSPQAPVIYEDRQSRRHLLPWWNIIALTELPSPEERHPGLQYCALTRMLLAAQVLRNTAIYQREQTGGRNTKRIFLVKGMTTTEIQDAVAQVKMAADQAGLLRYMNPVIAGSVDPKADIDVKTLDLASLPEGWDPDKENKWYIAQIAMAFMTDYQEFAPLPGGGLGSSAEAKVLHLKSRGKGPGLFMKLITQMLNFQILPRPVHFEFEEQDLEADGAQAEVKKVRAETREIDVKSGVLTPEGGRQQALDDGDISQEQFDAMGGSDVTPGVTATDEERARAKGAPAYSPFGGRTAEDWYR